MIYFDNNATTKIFPEVLDKMNDAYKLPLNNSATHKMGRKANQMVESAREELKNLLNAQNYDVIFTSSSTEASNNVIFGCDSKKILISKLEHPAVYNCRPTEKEIIEIQALENGLIDVTDFKNKLADITEPNFLVSVMLANNETGAIQPIAEIAKLTHQKGGLFHCDIVQAVGKIEVDLEALNVDFASVTAHKINGPQGVGALLYRKGLELKPLIFGGQQERSKRAGTTNVTGIIGFGEACKLTNRKIAEHQKIKDLRDFLESRLKEIAGDDVKIFADQVERLPNTSYASIKNSDSQTQLINFDLNGICVSSGPACSSGTTTASRILKAMNIASDFADGAIRVSLDTDNTKEEIEKFIKIWKDFYQKNKN